MRNNHIALGGLFACLHVLFLFVSKLLFGSELLLVLFLPLLSTIYAIRFNKKECVMFFAATVIVCGLFDFISTFIYIIPSIACGILYGFLRKKKFKELELLCITAGGHVICLMFSFFIISLLFKEVRFLDIFSGFFGLDGNSLIVVGFFFFIVLGFCEAFLVHIVSDNELSKFDSRVEKDNSVPRWFAFTSGVSFILFVLVYVFNVLYSVVFMAVFIIFFLFP